MAVQFTSDVIRTIVRRRHRPALLRNTCRDCSLNTVVPLVDTDLRYYVIRDVLYQPSTLSSWSHWPRGPVDFKSYWPPGKSTGPHFSPTDVYIRD